MSVHDQNPAGKHSRLGLYIPFGLAIAAVIGWSIFWVWARGQAEARVDQARADLTKAGYQISWKERTIGGYPFRLNINLTETSVREPGGWGLDAPLLEAQANAFSPGSWVIAAPQSLTFVRPEGGPVKITGELVRASLTHLSNRPPSLSFQAIKAAFAPEAGARPFAFTAADKVEFHLRAGPDDEGGVFLKVEGATARPGSVLAVAGQGKPVAMSWNSTLSAMSKFEGDTWADAVRNWTQAGGQMTVRDAGLSAGDAILRIKGGKLAADSDGRASGVLDLTLGQTDRVIAAMGQTGLIAPETADAAAAVARARQGAGGEMNAALTFQAGRTTLGPVAIAASPKVYERR